MTIATGSPAFTVLVALRAAAEGERDERGWRHVYLDNAHPAGMPGNTYAACLSVLTREGMYRPVDGYAWGEVLT